MWGVFIGVLLFREFTISAESDGKEGMSLQTSHIMLELFKFLTSKPTNVLEPLRELLTSTAKSEGLSNC